LNELAAKVLAYSVDWLGQTDSKFIECLLENGIKPKHLHTFERAQNKFFPTVNSQLFKIALLHFQETDALIDEATLAHRFKNDEVNVLARINQVDWQTIQQDSLVAVRAAREAPRNGSEIEYVCKELKDEHARYDIYRVMTEAANRLPSSDPLSIREELLDLLGGGNGFDDLRTKAFAVKERTEQRKELYQHSKEDPKSTEGLLTGFRRLDDACNGFNPGEVLLIVGGTGIGKTQLREYLLLNFWRNGHSVMDVLAEFYSDEGQFRIECMELSNKMPAPSGGLSLTQALKRGGLTADQEQEYYNMLEDQRSREADYIFVEPNAYDHINDIEPIIAKYKKQNNIQAVGIDDLHNQTLHGAHDTRDDLRQGEVIAYLKKLALRYKVTIITEVQEQQGTISRPNVRIGEVIKYSQKLSHKADFVLRLYKPDATSPDVIAQVLKHRTSKDSYTFPIYMDSEKMFVGTGQGSQTKRIDAPVNGNTSPAVPDFGKKLPMV